MTFKTFVNYVKLKSNILFVSDESDIKHILYINVTQDARMKITLMWLYFLS